MKKKRVNIDKEQRFKFKRPDKGEKNDSAENKTKDAAPEKTERIKPIRRAKNTQNLTKGQKFARRLLVFVCCVALIAVGYTGMDVYITRNAKAVHYSSDTDVDTGALSDVKVEFSADMAESIGLDDSVMLSAIMNETQKNGFTAIAFEAKRENGTIGYKSNLSSVDSFSAISFAAEKPQQSVQSMLSNDILPVAVIHCYKDNVVPAQANGEAIMDGANLYKDSSGNTYLKPGDYSYNYIRDIVAELNSYGVTVFVLDSCNLPDEISKKYDDGFDVIAKRLYGKIDANVKFLEAVNVTVSKDNQANDLKAIKKLKGNKVYVIKTDLSSSKLRKLMQKKSITTYIIDSN